MDIRLLAMSSELRRGGGVLRSFTEGEAEEGEEEGEV